MPLRFRITIAVLTACLLTAPVGVASAGWLTDFFQPVAFEDLDAPPEAAEAAEEVPTPVLEAVPSGDETSDSVLLNPPVAWDENWTPMPGELPPEAVGSGVWEQERDPPYASASPFWSPPLAATDSCCPRPTILHWNHPLLATTVCQCACDRMTDLVLSVPNGCCAVDVEVCVPACCGDVPDYQAGRDWLGRTTHHFCWPCGYELKVVQLHIGSWVVHTYNR